MMIVSEKHKKQYQEEGYVILENVLTKKQLEDLRSECQNAIDRKNAEMDELGVDVIHINHRNKRYFISLVHRESQKLLNFAVGDLMDELARAVLGNNVYLFHTSYVVKCSDVGTKFGWHQDSGYIWWPHKPYLTCWIALDDMSEENGTVYVLPYERAGTRELVKHIEEEGTNDLVGYHGDDPGIPAIVPAGSIVAFSTLTFHRSGANATQRMRRAFLAQYTPEPLMSEDGSRLWFDAVPLRKDGERIPKSELVSGK